MSRIGSQWKHYLPAAGLWAAAVLAVALPELTAFLVATGLVLVGAGYAWVVYRLQTAPRGPGYGERSREWPDREPDFRTVTGTLFRARWVRDVTP